MKRLLSQSPLLFPLPAVLVSCRRPGERPNLITLAWTGVAASDPPTIAISIRPSRYSHGIIKETGEFVVNVPAHDMLKEVDYCGIVSGRDYDKFTRTLLTETPATVVACPMVEEAVVNLECRVTQSLVIGSHEMFFGEIVAVHAEEEFLDEKERIRIADARPFAYCTTDRQYWSLGHAVGYYGFSRGSF